MIEDDAADALEALGTGVDASDEAESEKLCAAAKEVVVGSAELEGILLDAIAELDVAAAVDEEATAIDDTELESVGLSPIFTQPDLSVIAAGQLTSSQSTLGQSLASRSHWCRRTDYRKNLRGIICALKPVPSEGAAWLEGTWERRTGVGGRTAVLSTPDRGGGTPLR